MIGFILTLIICGGVVIANTEPLFSPVSMTSTVSLSGAETTTNLNRAGLGLTAVEGKLTLRYEIENYIKMKFGKDGERALKIAYCESSLNTQAIHANTNGTIDRGLFQLNTVHDHVTSECAFNAQCNIDAAYNLYLKQGFTPWVCNRKI